MYAVKKNGIEHSIGINPPLIQRFPMCVHISRVRKSVHETEKITQNPLTSEEYRVVFPNEKDL